MPVLLSWANFIVGGLLLFALSDIPGWYWFQSPESKLIVFILSVLLVGNAIMLALKSDELWTR